MCMSYFSSFSIYPYFVSTILLKKTMLYTFYDKSPVHNILCRFQNAP